jgi:hypothetical protein
MVGWELVVFFNVPEEAGEDGAVSAFDSPSLIY